MLIGLIVVAPFARTAPSSNDIWQGQSYLGNMDGIALGCLCAPFTDWCLLHRRVQRTPWPIIAWIGAVLASSAALGWLFARFFSEPLNRALRGSPLPPGPPVAEAHAKERPVARV